MRRLRPAALAAIGLSLLISPAAQAGLVTTVQGPGIQSSSAINTTSINFDSQSPGYKGSESFSLPGSLSANYQGTEFIVGADQYGGAGGAGNYFALQATNVVTLTLSASQAYFGLWVSAADFENKLEFFNGNTLVGSFLGNGPLFSSLSGDYLGNPNLAFLHVNDAEKYVYIDFYAQGVNDMFDKIVFTNLPGATSFESDNHTFSTTLQAPTAVPEPSTLASCGIALTVLSGLWIRRKSRDAVSV